MSGILSRFVVALLMLAPLGCSLSDSVSSISQSVSGSVSSSSPGGSERAYRQDVADYTAAHIKAGGDFSSFQVDLAKLAEQHGITNWEENMATYEAIGQGFAKAKVSSAELLAYKRTLGKSDTQKMDAIQRGYDAAK